MGKCKWKKACPYYANNSATCNETDGWYGDRLASCYIRMIEKENLQKAKRKQNEK